MNEILITAVILIVGLPLMIYLGASMQQEERKEYNRQRRDRKRKARAKKKAQQKGGVVERPSIIERLMFWR